MSPSCAQSAAGPRHPPATGENPLPVSRPSILAVSERRRAERWKSLALAISVLSGVLTLLSIRAGRAPDYVHVMDPLGNMYAGPVEPLADSSRFFSLTAIYATNSALQRSAEGFDLAELLKLYYSPRAIAKLERDQETRAREMKRRNVQWKPLIESISEPVATGAGRMVEVRGRVVTAGAFANRSFFQQPAFTLVLTLVRNPDLGKTGAYPWICDDVEFKLEEARPRK